MPVNTSSDSAVSLYAAYNMWFEPKIPELNSPAVHGTCNPIWLVRVKSHHVRLFVLAVDMFCTVLNISVPQLDAFITTCTDKNVVISWMPLDAIYRHFVLIIHRLKKFSTRSF